MTDRSEAHAQHRREAYSPWRNNLQEVVKNRSEDFTQAMVDLHRVVDEMALTKDQRGRLDRVMKLFFP